MLEPLSIFCMVAYRQSGNAVSIYSALLNAQAEIGLRSYL